MAASMNLVVFLGNITADPELKYTQNGTARTRFDIAINRAYKNGAGELQEETTYVPIITWGSLAENCANYLTKGRPVAVEGRLRIDSFENSEGERKKVVEVIANSVQFLGSKSDGPAVADAAAAPSGGGTTEEVPF